MRAAVRRPAWTGVAGGRTLHQSPQHHGDKASRRVAVVDDAFRDFSDQQQLD
jgi:hypothetical protein